MIMKKTILAWIFAFISVAGFSQNLTEHLTFLGIPINGTITQFQAKLQGKGCVWDKVTSSHLSAGCRAFKGRFADNKVDIYVYYDNKTKIVYRTKAVISGTSEDIALQQYEKIKGLLITKYGTQFCGYGTMSEKESLNILVTSKNLKENIDSSDSMSANGFKGEVDLYVTKDDNYLRYPYFFNLHIDYLDAINNEKHQNQTLEDI